MGIVGIDHDQRVERTAYGRALRLQEIAFTLRNEDEVEFGVAVGSQAFVVKEAPVQIEHDGMIAVSREGVIDERTHGDGPFVLRDEQMQKKITSTIYSMRVENVNAIRKI